MKEQQQLTVATLEARRNELSQQYDAAKRDRAVIALAVIEGDPQAAKRDQKLVAEALRLVDEIELTDAALVAAREREREAAAKRKAAADHDKAREVLARLEIFRQRGAEIDAAARQLAESYVEFEAQVAELSRSGIGPSIELIRVHCQRALATALIHTRLQLRHLPPNERHTFAELVQRWGRAIEAWAAERLKPKADKAA
jgi:hypothetical protein